MLPESVFRVTDVALCTSGRDHSMFGFFPANPGWIRQNINVILIHTTIWKQTVLTWFALTVPCGVSCLLSNHVIYYLFAISAIKNTNGAELIKVAQIQPVPVCPILHLTGTIGLLKKLFHVRKKHVSWEIDFDQFIVLCGPYTSGT